jgi:hypothetical protein
VHHCEDEEVARGTRHHREFETLETFAVGRSIAYCIDVMNNAGMGGVAIRPNVRFSGIRREACSQNHGCCAGASEYCQSGKITPLIELHCLALQLTMGFTWGFVPRVHIRGARHLNDLAMPEMPEVTRLEVKNYENPSLW